MVRSSAQDRGFRFGLFRLWVDCELLGSGKRKNWKDINVDQVSAHSHTKADYKMFTSLDGFILANLMARPFPSPVLEPVTMAVFPVRSTTVSGNPLLAPESGFQIADNMLDIPRYVIGGIFLRLTKHGRPGDIYLQAEPCR